MSAVQLWQAEKGKNLAFGFLSDKRFILFSFSLQDSVFFQAFFLPEIAENNTQSATLLLIN